jgi:hypothetical protein
MIFVLLPIGFSVFDILALAAFVAAAENHNDVACIFTKIDAVASTEEKSLDLIEHSLFISER